MLVEGRKGHVVEGGRELRCSGRKWTWWLREGRNDVWLGKVKEEREGEEGGRARHGIG